jgi:hypothetical protein
MKELIKRLLDLFSDIHIKLFKAAKNTGGNVSKCVCPFHLRTLFVTKSAEANRRELKACFGRVFNNKLGCFDDVNVLIYVDA